MVIEGEDGMEGDDEDDKILFSEMEFHSEHEGEDEVITKPGEDSHAVGASNAEMNKTIKEKSLSASSLQAVEDALHLKDHRQRVMSLTEQLQKLDAQTRYIHSQRAMELSAAGDRDYADI